MAEWPQCSVKSILPCIRSMCIRRSASVPHAATNMETITHSIYTIFLPTHNVVSLHENISPGTWQSTRGRRVG